MTHDTVTQDAMTREQFIEKVRGIIDSFVLPKPRLPYTEIEGSRLIATPSGCVREDGKGRIYIPPKKHWIVFGRNDDKAVQMLRKISLRQLNHLLFSQLEFPQACLDVVAGLRVQGTVKEHCGIKYSVAANCYSLDRSRLFIVSCTATRRGAMNRRFKEIS